MTLTPAQHQVLSLAASDPRGLVRSGQAHGHAINSCWRRGWLEIVKHGTKPVWRITCLGREALATREVAQ